MTGSITQPSVWALARRQHGVVSRAQLLACGLTRHGIQHRVANGRLHPVWPKVYAVGRPGLTREGVFMAAVLTCGPGAMLSHDSAAELWGIRRGRRGPIHVSLPSTRDVRRAGIRVHRRVRVRDGASKGIPVTDAAQTIIDLAPSLAERRLERVIDEADKLDLVHPAALREAAEGEPGAGAAAVRRLLDKRTFVLVDTELERRFLKIARSAGLEDPETQACVNGFDVDFFFRARGVVVEADGGRYHRTPSQQRRDRIRDQTHMASGLKPVRFTHDQIAHEAAYVAEVLRRL
jgi:very-short-patch-repair endonuclease